MPALLMLVEKTHPILREVMPVITDFTTADLQETIANMCYSIQPAQLARANAPFKSAAGMAANQWGLHRRLFLYSPEGSDGPCTVVLNPGYVPLPMNGEKAAPTEVGYEGCFSVPLATGLVERYTAIVASYDTPTGEHRKVVLQGWAARVFQHETDHLDGKLYDGRLDHFNGPPCLERVVFEDQEAMAAFWRNKRGE